MSESKTLERPAEEEANEWRVGPGAWIALIIVLLVFSGFFFKVEGMAWLGAFDFTTLGGAFGTMKSPETNTFIGSGGARFMCSWDTEEARVRELAADIHTVMRA